MLTYSYFKHTLNFAFDAKTSRGKIAEHNCYVIKINNGLNNGYGEASPLKGLSIDDTDNFEMLLSNVVDNLNQGISIKELDLDKLPSVNFAFETALSDLKNGGKHAVYNHKNTFRPIPINGLVWMNETEEMYKQALLKIEEGYNCIKIKIGALDFDDECRLLERIRKQFNAFKITLRLDANGAFDRNDALAQLKDLKRFDIHSIEQPIAPKQEDILQELIAKSPIHIALDEELIGLSITEINRLVQTVKPKYLILKPTLIGGLAKADEVIKICNKYNIGWWATSALESNIGLNAIAQWVNKYNNKLPQGLGTGKLYTNNFNSPLTIKNGYLHWDNKPWSIEG